MFKGTSRQVSMLEGGMWLDESARTRLDTSWAKEFRQNVLPLLLEAEAEFADLYGRVGRPNWSVARMLGCCLLQEMHVLADQAALDALLFDLRWQHALGLESADAYLSRRSLVGFRSRLVKQDPEMRLVRALFDRVYATARKQLAISGQEQRIDSTLVTSNIRVRGREGLFRQALTHFLEGLAKDYPDHLAQLSPALRHWHGEAEEAWGATATQDEQRVRITQMAQWLYEIVETFAGDEVVSRDARYLLVARLFAEQCELVEPAPGHDDQTGTDAAAGPRVQVVKMPCGGAGTHMRSIHDPDAGTGHKGVGYYVHVTETCRNQTTELITDYEIVSAAHSDTGRATGAIKRLAAAERCPEVLYADGGYPTPQSLHEAQTAGVVLYAPVHRGSMDDAVMTREDFDFNDASGAVLRCPQGHAPTRHGMRYVASERSTLHAFFDGAQCRACPRLSTCPVRGPNNQRGSGEFRLDIAPGIRLRDATFVAQQSTTWQETYRIRSGAEATMSELKRGHGMRRLRVRRQVRVALAVSFKVTACNVKRWLRAVCRVDAPPADAAALAAA